MDALIQYFETIPTLHRTLILVCGISFFWIIEGVFPIVRFNYNKWRHAAPNLFFTLTTMVVNLGFAFLILKISDTAMEQQFGLWYLMEGIPMLLRFLIGLMLLDLIGAWLVHRLEHQFYWMWKLHVVHHSDEQVDTTTALRHHPGESVLRAVFTCIAVFVVGAPIWLVMLYQSCSAIFSQFNHANLNIPEQLDKWISYLIVTPGMHRIHHHYKQPYTDKNYGNIFSIWDRLTGNYIWMPASDIHFGLDVFDNDSTSIPKLLKVPVDGHAYSVYEKYQNKSN